METSHRIRRGCRGRSGRGGEGGSRTSDLTVAQARGTAPITETQLTPDTFLGQVLL